MKKQQPKNHLSIQLQYKRSNDFKSFLYKSTNESKESAVKACIEKARELWVENEKYEPYAVNIIDQLTTEKHYEFRK